MDLTFEYYIKRSKILNENNGKAYMSFQLLLIRLIIMLYSLE